MSPTEQLEIETKYDVDEHAMLPALHELPGVASVAQPVELNLVAVYFDTAGFDLAAADPLLRGAGAEPAKGPSKLARALGDRVPEAEQRELPKNPTTADVFRAYAGEQVAAIYRRDPEVRRDLPDSVHKMRVATRRL